MGKALEVYIYDMLVKSSRESDHISQLREYFIVLNKYGMEVNPAKYSFGVASAEFLGYLVTERGIEANSKKLTTFLEISSPKTTREIHRLTRRIARRIVWRSLLVKDYDYDLVRL